jgi:hypothetical protein
MLLPSFIFRPSFFVATLLVQTAEARPAECTFRPCGRLDKIA